MESNSNNRDFERFLRENADQYRMLPSDKVWKGIHNTIHTRRRWYGIGLALLLLLTVSAVTLVMLSYPVSRLNADNITLNSSSPETKSPAATPVTLSPSAPSAKVKKEKVKLLPFSDETSIAVLDNTTAPATTTTVTSEVPPVTVSSPMADALSKPSDLAVVVRAPAIAERRAPVRQHTASPAKNRSTDTEENKIEIAIADASQPDETIALTEKQNTVDIASNELALPTIESLLMEIGKKRNQPKKIDWQLYFTPSISYRKLSDNKGYSSDDIFDPGNNPLPDQPDDINKAVTHKPDLGLELGLAARYPINDRLKLRAGLQFNINRYDIKAFVYTGEMANIDVSNGHGNNYVSAWTYYNNYSGYRTDWIKNFYFSVSAPIGAELKLLGNKNSGWGIIGTLQPTYIISDRAYLISSDYKNYAEVPWLIRRVNVSTSFETFAAFRTGRTQWQVGPQVRYQLLSSFQNKYPIKENLFDFGLKIGVGLNP